MTSHSKCRASVWSVKESTREQWRTIARGGQLKLKEQLDNIRRIYPRRNRYGQLTPDRSGKTAWSQTTLFTLFVSDENTHLIRPHLFKKRKPMTALQWADWFSHNLREVYVNGILPGIGIRTGKQWVVQRVIGWAAKNAESITRNSGLAKRRNKTAKTRRKNG